MKYQDEINKLSKLSYRVTQEKATEAPFTNKFYNHFEKGIYIDIISKVPLFSSTHKFECSCGWPSFFDEISVDELIFEEDFTHGMQRIEVIAKESKAHLGHLFNDGIVAHDYKRYCINSASLSFVPFNDLEKEGFSNYKYLFNV